MAHIHTSSGQHDLTVTAYIVRVDGPEPRALLHMHKKLQMLLPVGGHVELNETPWQALKHEIAEESGYDLSRLEVLQPKSRIKTLSDAVHHPYPIVVNTHDISPEHFHTDISYAIITRQDPTTKPDEDEATDLRWMSHAELRNLPTSAIYENTREVYAFIFEEALGHWDTVPTESYSLASPLD